MHKAIKCVIGVVVGAAVGVVSIPVYTALDSVAPVSYPICGSALGVMIGNEFDNKLVGGIVGLAVGAAMVPLAGVNATCRVWAQPVHGAIAGAMVASGKL